MSTALMTLFGLNNTLCSISKVFAEWIRKLKEKSSNIYKVAIMCTVQYTCMFKKYTLPLRLILTSYLQVPS